MATTIWPVEVCLHGVIKKLLMTMESKIGRTNRADEVASPSVVTSLFKQVDEAKSVP
jgi:hypothetical protein